MSKNQQKSTYNQARSQQNWEMQQYQNMWGPNGTAKSAFAPVSTAANQLLTGGGETPEMSSDQEDALNAIGTGEQAAQKQAASADASTYADLADSMKRAYARQGGYAPGFDANQQELARQAAEAENQATIAPAEQAAEQYQTQYNTDIGNRLQGLGLGTNMAAIPYNAKLSALGLTDQQINDLLNTQANIANNQKGPFANALSAIGTVGGTTADIMSSIP